jgi:hypothetical protein
MNNDISPFEVLGLIGFMGFYIVAKIWVYSKEYGTKKDKRDRVIRRGAEWDYNTKENENKNK